MTVLFAIFYYLSWMSSKAALLGLATLALLYYFSRSHRCLLLFVLTTQLLFCWDLTSLSVFGYLCVVTIRTLYHFPLFLWSLFDNPQKHPILYALAWSLSVLILTYGPLASTLGIPTLLLTQFPQWGTFLHGVGTTLGTFFLLNLALAPLWKIHQSKIHLGIALLSLALPFWPKPLAPTSHLVPIEISWIQPQINPEERYQKPLENKIYQKYLELTPPSSSPKEDLKLIVWPETSIPTMDWMIDPDANEFITNYTQDRNSALIAGGAEQGLENNSYYNSTYLISPTQGILDSSEKQCRVPFYEYLPQRELLQNFAPFKETPEVLISPSKPKQTLNFHQLKIATLVCYEIQHLHQFYDLKKQQPDLYLLSANTRWFKRGTMTLAQKKMALYLAILSQKPTLYVDNQGGSFFYHPLTQELLESSLEKEDSGRILTKISTEG